VSEGKCSAMPVQVWTCPDGYRLPQILNNWHIKTAGLSSQFTGHLYP